MYRTVADTDLWAVRCRDPWAVRLLVSRLLRSSSKPFVRHDSDHVLAGLPEYMCIARTDLPPSQLLSW